METITLFGRVLVSLAVVLGVMWVIARRARGGARKGSGRLIDVLGRQQVGKGAAVAVVRVAEKALVVGVTDVQVTVLGETDLATAEAIVAATNARAANARTNGRTEGRTEGRSRAKARASHRSGAGARLAGGGAHTARAIRSSRPTTPGARDRMMTIFETDDERRSALAGSALSPATWKQTIESLRDLTARPD